MARELMSNPVYYAPTPALESLYLAVNRSNLGRHNGIVYDRAAAIVNELGLSPMGEKILALNRHLKIFKGGFQLSEDSRQRNLCLGVALDCRIDPEGVALPMSVITRENLSGFWADDFSTGAKSLLRYSEYDSWLPRVLRGRSIPGEIIGGFAIGIAAGAYFTGDFLSSGVAGAFGGWTAGAAANYFDKGDQYAAEQAVEGPENLCQYFSNDIALKRIEQIATLKSTLDLINKIEKVLSDGGVDLPDKKFLELWRDAPEVRNLRVLYNTSLRYYSLPSEEVRDAFALKFAYAIRQAHK